MKQILHVVNSYFFKNFINMKGFIYALYILTCFFGSIFSILAADCTGGNGIVGLRGAAEPLALVVLIWSDLESLLVGIFTISSELTTEAGGVILGLVAWKLEIIWNLIPRKHKDKETLIIKNQIHFEE